MKWRRRLRPSLTRLESNILSSTSTLLLLGIERTACVPENFLNEISIYFLRHLGISNWTSACVRGRSLALCWVID